MPLIIFNALLMYAECGHVLICIVCMTSQPNSSKHLWKWIEIKEVLTGLAEGTYYLAGSMQCGCNQTTLN